MLEVEKIKGAKAGIFTEPKKDFILLCFYNKQTFLPIRQRIVECPACSQFTDCILHFVFRSVL